MRPLADVRRHRLTLELPAQQVWVQGDATTLSQVEDGAVGQSGLGIGLTLAKSLVELHGGILHASSAGLGLGSTLRFVLPGPMV